MPKNSLENKNYQNIHPNFTEELIEQWKSYKFSYQQTKQWIKAGLTPEESDLANWLHQENYSPEQITHEGLKKLTEIHRHNSWETISTTSNWSKEINPELKEVIINEIKKGASRAKIEAIIIPDIPNNNQVIVISSWMKYAVRLMAYERNNSDKILITYNKRFPNSDWKSGYSKEEAEDKAEEIKWKLETNYSLKALQKQNDELKNELTETQKKFARSQQLITHLEKEVNQLKMQVSHLQEKVSPEEKNIRNILLIGRTGKGKSTLANVLSDSQEFAEGKYGTSQTRDTQTNEFSVDNITYRVIDTVGIGDTQLTEEEVLNKIAEAAYSVKEGLYQILFVTNGRFDQAEMFAYDLLRKAIFDKNIERYTTIVKTRFDYFENEQICTTDKQKLKKENSKLFNLIEQVNDIIHVDNPVIDIAKQREREINKSKRQLSRKKLLDHLATCQEFYKPTNLKLLNNRISHYMVEKEELEQQVLQLSQNVTKSPENEAKIKALKQRVNTLKTNIQQETSQHLESKWSNWLDIANKFGGVVASLSSVASVVVAVACALI